MCLYSIYVILRKHRRVCFLKHRFWNSKWLVPLGSRTRRGGQKGKVKQGCQSLPPPVEIDMSFIKSLKKQGELVFITVVIHFLKNAQFQKIKNSNMIL